MSLQEKIDRNKKKVRVIKDPAEICEMVLASHKERRTRFGDNCGVQHRIDGEGRIVVIQKARPTLDASEGLPTKKECAELAKGTGFPWEDEYYERTFPVWSSDERVNRAGDIDLQTWRFDNYNRNPLVLFSHEWDALPIGQSISHSVKQRSDEGYDGPALHQVMTFATKETYEFADTVARLWKARFLRTVSVGFYPGMVIYVDNEDTRNELGLGPWGVIYGDEELVEVSPCSVPSLPSAHNSAQLQKAVKDNLLRASDADVVREIVRINVLSQKLSTYDWRAIDRNLRSTFKSLFPDMKLKEHPILEEPFDPDQSVRQKEEDRRVEEIQKELAELRKTVASQQTQIEGLTKRLDTQKRETASTQQFAGTLASVDAALSSIKGLKGSGNKES